jgi:hypothetical protein
MIPAFERAKTVDASDRAATVVGKGMNYMEELGIFKKIVLKWILKK